MTISESGAYGSRPRITSSRHYERLQVTISSCQSSSIDDGVGCLFLSVRKLIEPVREEQTKQRGRTESGMDAHDLETCPFIFGESNSEQLFAQDYSAAIDGLARLS